MYSNITILDSIVYNEGTALFAWIIWNKVDSLQGCQHFLLNNFFLMGIFSHRNQFVMEYSGEVMGYEEFEKRVEMYDRDNRRHYYFMTLRADEVRCFVNVLHTRAFA